jgi:hypothetical protein
MRRTLFLMAALAMPAVAGPADGALAGLAVYGLYGLMSCFLVGWAFLVTTLVRPRVELTAQVLQKRPLASFLMGLLSLGWLFLAVVIANAAPGLGGLLIVVTLSILILCALVGLPAILVGLGHRASQLWDRHLSLPKEMLLGAVILFTAGGFPWLGQLMLIGLLLWSCGGAVLGFFAGGPREEKERAEATTLVIEPGNE